MTPQLRLCDANLPDYLRQIGVLSPEDAAEVEPAGEGNINWVRRVRVPSRAASWVVKQARPTLERFPEYAVHPRRAGFEARYYEVVAPLDPGGICPAVRHFDAEHWVLVLEDLGGAERLDAALARGADVSEAARSLGAFLGRVHGATRNAALAERFDNDEMRRLHGDHIFHLPYRENDFPLAPEVALAAREIRDDGELVARIDAAYARYLEPVGGLVHADVQPTNVLLSSAGPRLLDAEIAHVGDPAFDLGILAAHLLLAALADGDLAPARATIAATWTAYRTAHGADGAPGFSEVIRYAGIEMLRRTIGAARVPAADDDATALAFLAAGRRWVMAPPSTPDDLAVQAISSRSSSAHSMRP